MNSSIIYKDSLFEEISNSFELKNRTSAVFDSCSSGSFLALSVTAWCFILKLPMVLCCDEILYVKGFYRWGAL